MELYVFYDTAADRNCQAKKFQKVPYPSGILPYDCEYSERMLKECWKKMLKEAAFTAGMFCFHGRKMVN